MLRARTIGRKENHLPGQLNKGEYSQLLKYLRHILDGDPLGDLTESQQEKLARALLSHGLHWWRYYELPFAHHIAVVCKLVGCESLLIEASKAENPIKTFFNSLQEDSDGGDRDGVAIEQPEFGMLLNLLISLEYSMEAIRHFGLSINELLERAKTGDVAAVRNAISIDRTVVATNIGVATIATAQFLGDKKMLSGLFKRVQPHERRRTHRDLRFMRRVFVETGALEKGVTDELMKFISNDLKLYSTTNGDATKNLRELFRQFKRESNI